MNKCPTDILEEEHRAIQKVIGALAVLAESLETGHEVDIIRLHEIVEFMRTFADKCHHGKEETHLFPLLVARGIPFQGCPLGVLNHEHIQGRTLVTALAEAVEGYAQANPGARDALLKSLRGLVALYPNHIWKEDYLLFPVTNKVLTREEQVQLYEEFEKVEQTIGMDNHQRLADLANQLTESVA